MTRECKEETMPRVCEMYGISDEGRDSIIMAIRKQIEDWPDREVKIKSISEHSGMRPSQVKVVMFTMLCMGDLVCNPVGDDGIIHFFNKNSDGSARG